MYSSCQEFGEKHESLLDDMRRLQGEVGTGDGLGKNLYIGGRAKFQIINFMFYFVILNGRYLLEFWENFLYKWKISTYP